MLTVSRTSPRERDEVKSEDETENQDLSDNSVTGSTLSEFPTLIPLTTANNTGEKIQLTAAPFAKIRSEGRITSETKLNSIRNWRKRLYKAFKNRSKITRIIRKSPSEEIVEMNDVLPTIMDKNRQIILSRTEPSRQSVDTGKHIQTYGRDPNGKLIPLFSIEPTPMIGTEKQEKIESYPPREIRYSYRTTNRQPLAFVPASSAVQNALQNSQIQNTIPVPVASYLVTANPPPQPIQLHIFPSLPFTPALQAHIDHQETTSTPPLFTYSTFPSTSSTDNRDECNNGQCRPESDEEKCNSQRLRSIIFNNIVNGDAEASKRSVQSAAEAETGIFFDVICGTGFFSYIAHTDEFCLASSGGVNCYVFAPVCQQSDEQRKKMLSRN